MISAPKFNSIDLSDVLELLGDYPPLFIESIQGASLPRKVVKEIEETITRDVEEATSIKPYKATDSLEEVKSQDLASIVSTIQEMEKNCRNSTFVNGESGTVSNLIKIYKKERREKTKIEIKELLQDLGMDANTLDDESSFDPNLERLLKFLEELHKIVGDVLEQYSQFRSTSTGLEIRDRIESLLQDIKNKSESLQVLGNAPLQMEELELTEQRLRDGGQLLEEFHRQAEHLASALSKSGFSVDKYLSTLKTLLDKWKNDTTGEFDQLESSATRLKRQVDHIQEQQRTRNKDYEVALQHYNDVSFHEYKERRTKMADEMQRVLAEFEKCLEEERSERQKITRKLYLYQEGENKLSSLQSDLEKKYRTTRSTLDRNAALQNMGISACNMCQKIIKTVEEQHQLEIPKTLECVLDVHDKSASMSSIMSHHLDHFFKLKVDVHKKTQAKATTCEDNYLYFLASGETVEIEDDTTPETKDKKLKKLDSQRQKAKDLCKKHEEQVTYWEAEMKKVGMLNGQIKKILRDIKDAGLVEITSSDMTERLSQAINTHSASPSWASKYFFPDRLPANDVRVSKIQSMPLRDFSMVESVADNSNSFIHLDDVSSIRTENTTSINEDHT